MRDWRNGKHPPVRGYRRRLYEITGLTCYGDAANWEPREKPCRKIGEERAVPLLAELVVRCGLPTREVKQIRLSQIETDGIRLGSGRFIRFDEREWEKVNRASLDAWVERAGPTNYLFYSRKPVDRDRPASAQWIATTLQASGTSLRRSQSAWLHHAAGDFARLGGGRKGFLHHMRSVHGLSKGGAATLWQVLRDKDAFARAAGRKLFGIPPELAYAALYPVVRAKGGAPKKDKASFTIFNEIVQPKITRFHEGFTSLAKAKKENPSSSQYWGDRLSQAGFSGQEVSAILASRNAETAAIRWAAANQGLSFKTGKNYYSQAKAKSPNVPKN